MSNVSNNYDDIIALPHHRSERHPHMPLQDRAAQFAPFAALTGFGDAVDETARLTQERIDLTESERAQIDLQLQELDARLGEDPAVHIVYFRQDPLKDGGEYVTAVGRVRRLDRVRQTILLDDGTEVYFTDIYALSGDY